MHNFALRITKNLPRFDGKITTPVLGLLLDIILRGKCELLKEIQPNFLLRKIIAIENTKYPLRFFLDKIGLDIHS